MTTEEPKGIKSLQASEESPFLKQLEEYALHNFKIQSYTPKSEEEAMILATGECTTITHYNESETVRSWKDNTPFVKYFRSLDNFHLLRSLSKNARTLLDYVELKLGINETNVSLNYQEYRKAIFGDSTNKDYKSAYYRAIKELCLAGLLAKKNNSTYHINVLVIYNGRRELLLGGVADKMAYDINNKFKPHKGIVNQNLQ